MAITLHTIHSAKGATRGKKRVGRGLGSKGTTAGRGQKGQKARSGVGGLKRRGMRNLMLATPKLRGFRSLAPRVLTVNVGDIAKKFIAGEMVTPVTLHRKGLISRKDLAVKILAKGDIGVAVTLKNVTLSAGAKEKIEQAGGKLTT